MCRAHKLQQNIQLLKIRWTYVKYKITSDDKKNDLCSRENVFKQGELRHEIFNILDVKLTENGMNYISYSVISHVECWPLP